MKIFGPFFGWQWLVLSVFTRQSVVYRGAYGVNRLKQVYTEMFLRIGGEKVAFDATIDGLNDAESNPIAVIV